MSAAGKYGPSPVKPKDLDQVKQSSQTMKQAGVSAGKETAQPTGPNPTPSAADKYGAPRARGRDLAQEKGKQGPQMER